MKKLSGGQRFWFNDYERGHLLATLDFVGKRRLKQDLVKGI